MNNQHNLALFIYMEVAAFHSSNQDGFLQMLKYLIMFRGQKREMYQNKAHIFLLSQISEKKFIISLGIGLKSKVNYNS